jgi:hypothetical protein
MAVKLPPDSWVAQVITLKGFQDRVYSKINGSVLGYVKDGKFVQTVDKLPVRQPKKRKEEDKIYAAKIKQIAALNAIPSMELDAEYYRSVAENPKKTPAERKKALTEYNKLIVDIKAKQKEAGVSQTAVKTLTAEKTAAEIAKTAGKRATELEKEYAKLQDEFKLIIDPKSGSAENLKNKMDKLVTEYRSVYSKLVGSPISLTAARLQIKSKLPKPSIFTKQTGVTGPTADTKPTGPTGPTFGKQTKDVKPTKVVEPVKVVEPIKDVKPTEVVTPDIKPGVSTGSMAGDELAKREGAAAAIEAAKSVGVPVGDVAKPNTPLDVLLKQTEFWYDLPDYIFKLDPKLGELLVEAVAGEWDAEKFLAKAKLTPWWQKNAQTVRTKIIERAKYDELKAAGEDIGNTEYGMYLDKQVRAVKAQAKAMSGVTLTDLQAQSIAQKIYDGNLEDDALAINALLVPYLGKVTSIVGNGVSNTSFGGDALKNYQTLQGIAKANGFSIKDILPNISALTAGGDLETAVLRGLADGSLDINRISQDARMLASQGQPEYVRGLLNQGYDLQDIYAPYRSQMASVLELDPNTIELNDPTLRSAITDKGDMNLYDFKKLLKQDKRWQYTASAKEEVSSAALGVIRDFGFQG